MVQLETPPRVWPQVTQQQGTGHRGGVAGKHLYLLRWSTRDAPGVLCVRLWEGEIISGNGRDL